MIKPELIAPAGDLEKLKVAFHFGADAVYIGLKNFSLRVNAKNFDNDQFIEAVKYTHKINKKIYVAVNIYFTPDEMNELIEQLKFINKIKPDGIIISDLGALYLAKEYSPDVPIHISTQTNITNHYAAKFLASYGVKRIVLARELTLNDIKKISEFVNVELEAFVHGAMCVAYSGRCFLSSYMTKDGLGARKDMPNSKERSANKGDCAHSCRWEYIIREVSRDNQDYTVIQNGKGSFILSSKDICMVDHIKELIDCGITSFKIEGRMKSILYISSIVRAYRNAIDSLFDPKVEYNKDEIHNELDVVSHREFCTGFYFEKPYINPNLTERTYSRKIRLAAMVDDVKNKRAILKVYNTINLNPDSKIEYIAPKMKTITIASIKFYDNNNNPVEKAIHNSYIEAEFYDINGNLIKPDKYDIIRMEAKF
jgi:putative protease